MDSISEYLFSRLLHRLIPPLICLVQYFTTVVLVLMLVLVDCPWIVTIIIVFMVFVSGVMLPFWYKTFFDPSFVGPDRPLWVQWSDNDIRFRGAYFDIKVPIKNVLGYKVIGFRRANTTFTLKVKVGKMNGAVENMWLSSMMPRKEDFIDFLEQHRTTE